MVIDKVTHGHHSTSTGAKHRLHFVLPEHLIYWEISPQKVRPDSILWSQRDLGQTRRGKLVRVEIYYSQITAVSDDNVIGVIFTWRRHRRISFLGTYRQRALTVVFCLDFCFIYSKKLLIIILCIIKLNERIYRMFSLDAADEQLRRIMGRAGL